MRINTKPLTISRINIRLKKAEAAELLETLEAVKGVKFGTTIGKIRSRLRYQLEN